MMLSMHLGGLGFSSLPHTGLAYSEAVFAATHNSYSGDLDTESAAGRFSVFTSSGERCGPAVSLPRTHTTHVSAHV